MHIETVAQRLKSETISRAREFDCTPQEIAALEEDDFFEDAEAAIRAELAALRLNHRRAIRAVTSRKPATRRAPRRAAKKASVSSGGGDGAGDGPGPWSLNVIDHYFALGALPILSPTYQDRGSGEFSRYRGPTLLPRLPHVAISVVTRGNFPDRKLSFSWSDAISGRHGEGVVKLVADILKISESEAAKRVVQFYAVARTACGSGEGIDRTIARFRKDYIDPYLHRAA